MNSSLFHRKITHSQSLPYPLSTGCSPNKLPQLQHSSSVYPVVNAPATPSKSNCIVFFDWDDTLFPTNALLHHASDINCTQLSSLSQSVLNVLNQYITLYGHQNVFIVTNGHKHWVLESLQIAIYLCDLQHVKHSFQCIYDLVSNEQIKTISARDLFSDKYPNQSLIWKYLAFQQILKSKLSANNKQSIVISVGDSSDEYNASNLAVNNLKSCDLNIALHRLKLTTKPNTNEMIQQFHLMMLLGDVFGKMTENITIDYEDAKADFLKKRTQ